MSTSAQKSRPTAAAADAQESSGPLVGKTNSPYVRGIRFGAAEQALADVLGVSVSGGTEARISSAISKTNSALRLVIEAGLMLLSIRSECEHGEFEALLESHGMPSQRASEAMTYARFAASLSPEDRDRVIELPKTKVLELAKADPEVLQDLFEDDAKFGELTALSVRDLRVALRDANAKRADLSTRNEKLERERDRLQDELRELHEGRVKTGADVPVVVQNIRLECAALHKKALMAAEDIGQLGHEFLTKGLPDDSQWNTPVMRHLYGSLAALHAVIGGQIADMHRSFGALLDGEPSVLDTFSPDETTRCALEYRALIQEHDHEAKAREWEREMNRPRKVGRPRNAPTK
ncbi:hypothetical protein [Burkholderia glumae]|uniref:DUF3102 domain-containing protein n=2 Tax=Burkholderia glumae TaxID=337 RepID=A0AAP9XYL9_BURGL|nr:hypothetical protein [Burkholderia glumae]AJY64143.1 hypothetical protein KS03_3744 [Burkholderia glumae LMG 2196 = ATCC 33617]KHJ60787.1 hypothetical protein NCPPB3923_22280 [Burkholderia glumae]MCM2484318.1 hypothetical protein [Burkholderia glumae]MCM2510009.1 hypothetical protein [Burkholderia glumae]MCM2539772.1 hypothetical protein [Burkholderia glumae]